MKIELRRISHNARLSEETEAFAADLYIDGEKRGTVSNRGHGGCHDYSDWNTAKELNEYAKTLPRLKFPEAWGSPLGDGDNTYAQSADSLVDDELAKFLRAKAVNGTRNQLLRAMKTKTLFTLPRHKTGEYAYFKGTDQRIIDHIAKKYPEATILTPANMEAFLAKENTELETA